MNEEKPQAVPEIAASADPLSDIPMVFRADERGNPVYPPLTPDQKRELRYDRTIQFGPGDLRSIGRAMMDVKHELTLRGYFIEACQAGHKPALVQPANGTDSDQHEARMRIRF